MGPRLQERGVCRTVTRATFPDGGFNGAALTRARSCRLYLRHPTQILSFNGAALTRARSWRHNASARRWQTRFNGAALTRARSSEPAGLLPPPLGALQWGRAYKSAEFEERMPLLVEREIASMGPRLQERGVTPSHETIQEDSYELQWGRAYKSAELRRVKAIIVLIVSLQWGRAYKSAEFRL